MAAPTSPGGPVKGVVGGYEKRILITGGAGFIVRGGGLFLSEPFLFSHVLCPTSQTPRTPLPFLHPQASHVVILLAQKYPNYKIVNFDKLVRAAAGPCGCAPVRRPPPAPCAAAAARRGVFEEAAWSPLPFCAH